MLDRERVRRAFGHPVEFTTSPLYRELSRTVAASDQLLDLARQGRPGQYPTFLFFGAVHRLLLRGVGHPLAGYYPSVAGDAALPAAGAGPELESFGRAYAAELTETIRTRLVQTSVVQRTLGLRIGLSAIATATGREPLAGPLHVIEVGASAGLNLRFDRYGYRLSGDRYGAAGRQYGDPDSPVQLAAEVYGPAPLPDLDRIPAIGRVQGVDLNPVDAADPDAREWLEALVWPENHTQRQLLGRALAAVAADPPPIEAGDAVDVLPEVAAGLPAGEPRLVFHAATRIHVPRERQAAFDAAILAAGATGPQWHLSVEGPPQPDPRPSPTRYGAALLLRDPAGHTRTVAVVDGHLRWIETLDEVAR
ncbi:MAG TPA: DUF2332 domain-containing protein [Streptosporangiaceae bacterium]|nr:DUF2332 domain-containing protein [Streptosporangiaceae bacterium]